MIQSAIRDGRVSTHSIAPAQVIRGAGAWNQSFTAIQSLTQRPLLLGRSFATQSLRDELVRDLRSLSLSVTPQTLDYDCCEQDLQRLESAFSTHGCDAVIAAGGGKVLDAGKLLAHRKGVACITVPLSAATCAGWTALSNLYSPSGAFQGDQALDRCPDLLVFDHDLLLHAPARTLASGIADALAKWPGRGLDSRSLCIFWVSWSFTSKLSEIFYFLQRKVIS